MAISYEIPKVKDEFTISDEIKYNVSVKVIGVGGGGGNALKHMAKLGIKGVDYIAANTDVPALRKMDGEVIDRMQIGTDCLGGRGAGGKPEVGRSAAFEDKEKIQERLKDTNLLFISAGMGGGTGTGAAPAIAEIAKEMGILTVGVVTKPFDFEQKRKMNIALGGIAEMRKHVDTLIIIPNQKLIAHDENMTVDEAFEMVDNVLYKVVNSIYSILDEASDINVDYEDLKAILSESGDAHIAIGSAKGDKKVSEIISQITKDPLLETKIDNAGRMLIHMCYSKNVTMGEVHSVVNELTSAATEDVEVIYGCNMDEDLEDEMIVTVVATYFNPPMMRQNIAAGHVGAAGRPNNLNANAIPEGMRAAGVLEHTGNINNTGAFGNTSNINNTGTFGNTGNINNNDTFGNTGGFGNITQSSEELRNSVPLDKYVTQNLTENSDGTDAYSNLDKVFAKSKKRKGFKF